MKKPVICNILEGESKLFTHRKVYEVESIHGDIGIIRDDFNIMHYVIVGNKKNWFGATIQFMPYVEERRPSIVQRLIRKLALAIF